MRQRIVSVLHIHNPVLPVFPVRKRSGVYSCAYPEGSCRLHTGRRKRRDFFDCRRSRWRPECRTYRAEASEILPRRPGNTGTDDGGVCARNPAGRRRGCSPVCGGRCTHIHNLCYGGLWEFSRSRRLLCQERRCRAYFPCRR